MPRINFNGQSFDVPERLNGQDIRQTLGLSQNEIPVRVRGGDYEPVNEHDEYRIEDGSQYDKVNRLANG